MAPIAPLSSRVGPSTAGLRSTSRHAASPKTSLGRPTYRGFGGGLSRTATCCLHSSISCCLTSHQQRRCYLTSHQQRHSSWRSSASELSPEKPGYDDQDSAQRSLRRSIETDTPHRDGYGVQPSVLCRGTRSAICNVESYSTGSQLSVQHWQPPQSDRDTGQSNCCVKSERCQSARKDAARSEIR